MVLNGLVDSFLLQSEKCGTERVKRVVVEVTSRPTGHLCYFEKNTAHNTAVYRQSRYFEWLSVHCPRSYIVHARHNNSVLRSVILADFCEHRAKRDTETNGRSIELIIASDTSPGNDKSILGCQIRLRSSPFKLTDLSKSRPAFSKCRSTFYEFVSSSICLSVFFSYSNRHHKQTSCLLTHSAFEHSTRLFLLVANWNYSIRSTLSISADYRYCYMF